MCIIVLINFCAHLVGNPVTMHPIFHKWSRCTGFDGPKSFTDQPVNCHRLYFRLSICVCNIWTVSGLYEIAKIIVTMERKIDCGVHSNGFCHSLEWQVGRIYCCSKRTGGTRKTGFPVGNDNRLWVAQPFQLYCKAATSEWKCTQSLPHYQSIYALFLVSFHLSKRAWLSKVHS